VAGNSQRLASILVTSAGEANGGGHDAVLAFSAEGEFLGPFSDDPRIVDPRGLCIDPSGALIYLNSADRMLALDRSGRVVRDSRRMADLDPGGAVFGPDGRFYVTMRRRRTILGISATLDGPADHFSRKASSHSHAGSVSGGTAACISPRASTLLERATTRSWCSTPTRRRSRVAWSPIPN
jgi:hypothetical protein